MSKQKTSWNTKENADVYDAYAQSFSMYKDTSRDLVDIAGIVPSMTVIDLAAGTGATTQAILDKTNSNIRVFAIDQAEEMLKKAEERFKKNKNITYIVSQAEEVNLVVREPADVVICNSAFWQMVPGKTLRAVSHVLKDGGIFVFNLPDQFFEYEDFENKPRKPVSYHLHDLEAWGESVGLALTSHIVKVYEKTAEEIIAFSRIPVMKKFANEEEEREFANRVLSNKTPRKSEWVYFVFKREETSGAW